MLSFWSGKKVLVTGHTGFKGSWISLWLHKLGAKVIGYALEPPTKVNMFDIMELSKSIISVHGDIRDYSTLEQTIEKYSPEIIFHLAAQPLVIKSYSEPLETLHTNVIGTANLFDIVRKSNSVKVLVNITSDKCYENREWPWGYRETDPMGGYDLYSCSKGCSELLTNSFRKSFFDNREIFLASARAGNVIGGGDWADDRIVVDIVNALSQNNIPVLRNPYAIRPWQHVLEPLDGYMMLAEKMWSDGTKYAEAWNFGPDDTHNISVLDLTNTIMKLWGVDNKIDSNSFVNSGVHEAQFLKLDSSKAKLELGWYTKLSMDDTLMWTVEWYKAYNSRQNMKLFSMQQIDKYEGIRRCHNEL